MAAVTFAFAGVGNASQSGTYSNPTNPNAPVTTVGGIPRYVMQPTEKWRPAAAEPFLDKYYIGARFNYNLASFSNKYSLASDPSDHENDSFSFTQQFGFDITGGWQFADKWRAELNYGNFFKYTDRDSDSTFDLSTQFLTLNGIYTAYEWKTTSFYVGAGAGIGVVRTAFSNSVFAHNATTNKTSIGFAGQVMAGLEEKITDNLYLGLTYKLSYLTGHKQEIELLPHPVPDTLISKTSGILNNTFGIGLRFEF